MKLQLRATWINWKPLQVGGSITFEIFQKQLFSTETIEVDRSTMKKLVNAQSPYLCYLTCLPSLMQYMGVDPPPSPQTEQLHNLLRVLQRKRANSGAEVGFCLTDQTGLHVWGLAIEPLPSFCSLLKKLLIKAGCLLGYLRGLSGSTTSCWLHLGPCFDPPQLEHRTSRRE